MSVQVRARSVALMALALFLLGSAGQAHAACVQIDDGLLLPTGSHTPPVLASDRMQDLGYVYIVDTLSPTKKFTLRFVGTSMGLNCDVTDDSCHTVPDFDVAWYTSAGKQLDVHNTPGDEADSVPSHADHGVVYMAFGPDVGRTDGDDRSARFELRLDCA